MNDYFKDKVALVTGGSRGIGLGIAKHLVELGAEVILTSRTLEDAAAAAEIAGAGAGTARGLALDISNADQTSQAIKSLLGDYGKIPFLINNAGITRDNLLLRLKPDDWDQVVQTNLGGVYRMCRALVPSMVRARFGRIVNISSVVAESGNPGQTNYAATKAGIEAFSRSLALEVASRNITVNCVAPGFIETDMTRDLGEDARKKLLERVPLGRIGTAQDIAAAVAFLIGPSGDYVTGTTLKVNGGMQM